MVEGKKEQPDEPVLELDEDWWGTDEPPKADEDEPPKAGEVEGNERPTLAPTFDLEAFAKEKGAPPPAHASLRPAAVPSRLLTHPPSEPFSQAFSQPVSQRRTPPQGSARMEGSRTPAKPARQIVDAVASDDDRPPTVRIKEETLLALANKVAETVAPTPAPGRAPPPEEEDPFASLAEELWATPAGFPAPAPPPPPPDRARAPAPSPAAPDPALALPPDARPTPLAVSAVTITPLPPSLAPTIPGEPSADDPFSEMRDRFALGDYSGALVMAESLLEENPSHSEALEYAESCRTMLTKMYTARIGPLDRVPLVEVERDQLRWLSIDHRAGFVLSLVDGMSSLEMILDVSGMRELDALRILYELVQQRIISFH